MSGKTGPRGLARRVISNPVGAVRTARAQRLRATLLAIDALPVPIRRGVFRPVDAMVRVILRRDGEHPDAGAVHIIALHAMGQTRGARDEALDLGSGSRTRTATRAARVA